MKATISSELYVGHCFLAFGNVCFYCWSQSWLWPERI